MKPMARLHTMMTPKWTGSTPNLTMRGMSMGERISVAEADSMRAPTMSRSMFTMSSMTYLFEVMEIIHPESASGTCSTAIT